MKPLVSIILLNWNGYDDTLEALESLYQINYPNYNVIVVDNASSNDSIDKILDYAKGNIEVQTKYTNYIKDTKPIDVIRLDEDELNHKVDYTTVGDDKKLLLIENHDNYGFARGNNIAIDYTMKYDEPEYVLLLNNDTIVDPNFLIRMIDVATADETIGLLGPKFYYYDYEGSHNEIWCVGSVVDLDHYPGHHSIMEEENYDLSRSVVECDWVSGAGALIKSEAISNGEYLDTNFFFGCEDVDLAVRLKEAGYSVVTVMDSIIWHKVGMSRHKSSVFKREKNHIKTNLAFIKKHKDDYYLNLPKYIFQIAMNYVRALLNKF
ncbi:MAG: glycosyltransferase family 2 protein [Methanosphaera sp.]|uniref:glycosyltransferase family 2 protein n=1 Tax=Methanosphaera sp. TaxID=2666342 RepID=UPI0025F54C3B|nr:glycosyltransferase family 2 protein [Methanosphaera sp.]MCI5866757.1 glycosyltransferase family 2 protein [Methanosphaera sp.]MDD6534271.1 glycosyltransferase family 2 protein [Methanosphaera sp.]MDY3956344.1 glycosyltransferase family 2 protein [Methanosphaera sp.]